MSYDIFFVRRDPGQTFEDALDDRSWEPGHEDGEQLAHLLGRQRLEDERREVPPPGAPIAPAIEELGPR